VSWWAWSTIRFQSLWLARWPCGRRVFAGVYGLIVFWCVDCAFSILEACGFGAGCVLVLGLWVSHPVGVLRQYVSGPGHGGLLLCVVVCCGWCVV
jgi:hypothetical protein